MTNSDNIKMLHRDVFLLDLSNKRELSFTLYLLSKFYENIDATLTVSYDEVKREAQFEDYRRPSIISTFLDKYINKMTNRIVLNKEPKEYIRLFTHMKNDYNKRTLSLNLSKEAYYLCSHTYATIKDLENTSLTSGTDFENSESTRGFIEMLKRYSDK